MNMHMRSVKLVVALVAMGGFQAATASQPSGWQVGGAMPYALNGLKDWTHQPLMGLCVDGAYQDLLGEGTVFYRVGLGLHTFPGKEQDGMKISLSSMQLYGDVVIPVATTRFSLVTGLSIHRWSRSVSGRSPLDPTQDNSVSGPVGKSFGKIGFQAGVEYTMTERLTFSAQLHVSEFGTNSAFLKGGSEIFGTSAVNPSWVQLGVRYHF